jgi:hypothetical protein
MGFWDLVIYDKALLAKQCWRLLQNPNSLAIDNLKAKYYPRTNVLEDSLGKRPSFAWWSLFSVSNIVKNGLVWRVRDGRDIQVWGD